ncbi:interleukin-17F-like [Clupea harengus]|uniref:Interleukin-17F-like n=1 Tax=Clupea harengus TaxID=7950 RepID=A0A6P3VN39_CLUHA|nr:interleukin-17F-like [Clupea harengus]
MTTTQDSQASQIFKLAVVLALALLLLEVDGVCSGNGGRKGRNPKSSVNKKLLLFNGALPKLPVQISAIHNKSLSPWEITISRDSSRVPKFISEARCLKKGCVGPDGEEDLSLESAPIQHEVMVLKMVHDKVRGQRKRKREIVYQLSFQVITVGCTCIRPSVVRHD